MFKNQKNIATGIVMCGIATAISGISMITLDGSENAFLLGAIISTAFIFLVGGIFMMCKP